MTTFTIPGIHVDYEYTSAVNVGPVQTEVIVPSDSATFNYQITGTNAYGQPIVEINDNSYQILINGTLLSDLNPNAVEATMSAVSWSGGTTTVLQVSVDTGANSSTDFLFVLGGAPLPNISSISDWDALDSSITGVSAPTGAFAAGADIPWNEFDNGTVTENDTFLGTAGADDLSGGIGDDHFFNTQGNDSYHGGVGIDQVDFVHDTSGVTANLATGTATDSWGNTDHLFGIENLGGSDYNDTLIGNGLGNKLLGGLGDDTLNGNNGADILNGQAGFDKLLGGGGADTLNGGGGADKLFGQAGTDVLNGGGGFDTLNGGKGNDKLYGLAGNDVMSGQVGADRLDGGSGNDKLFGNAGFDKLLGGGGADKLFGGNGNDKLYGGNGVDVLNGQAGDDLLFGGGKADKFVFVGDFGNDTIGDFQTAGTAEKIDLSGVAALGSFQDVTAHLTEVNGNAVIDDGLGHTITLDGVAMADLLANDFIF